MSKGAYINDEGVLVIDMAEADKYWDSLTKDQQFNAMCIMFDPLLARGKEMTERIRELEADLAALREARDEVKLPKEEASCVNCDKTVDTREVDQGGNADGAEIDDGIWVCSEKCYDAILATLEPAPVTPAEAASDEQIMRAMHEEMCGCLKGPDCPRCHDYLKAFRAALRTLSDAGEAG